MRRPAEKLGQHRLALELRYEIDLARDGKQPEVRLERIRELIRENPTSARSRHVAHNLGDRRLRWLEAQGLAMIGGHDVPRRSGAVRFAGRSRGEA